LEIIHRVEVFKKEKFREFVTLSCSGERKTKVGELRPAYTAPEQKADIFTSNDTRTNVFLRFESRSGASKHQVFVLLSPDDGSKTNFRNAAVEKLPEDK
jgi:hypothetical protein